jgi:ATP synthase protein I
MSMPLRRQSRDGDVSTVGGAAGAHAPSRLMPHDDLADPGSSAAWSIISYILSGILFWGGLGWLLDNWLFDPDTSVFLPCGVLVGTAAGGYLGYMRFLQLTQPRSDTVPATGTDH